MKRHLLLFLLFTLFSQFSFSQTTDHKDSVRSLTILYTNDLHAHFEPMQVNWISETRKVGGFANIATIVKTAKKSNPNTLYFDAGDYFTGPKFSSLTKGEAVIDVLNHLSIDAACIGNHEFDHGWQNLEEQLKKATFPILNGNIFYAGTDRLFWNHPYVILEKNGIRIGVIGLHGKYAFYDTIADIMIRGIEARDEEVYLKKYIKELEGQVDLIVLLVHEGIPGKQSSAVLTDAERNLQRDIELAKSVPGIDIIITGHAHQGTHQPLISNGTIIVSTDALGMEVGELDIQYDPGKDKITGFKNSLNYVFDDEIEDDAHTKQAIEKWKNKLSEIADQKIGTISQSLTRSYSEESLMGNMVADAMLHAYPDNDLAITNSGGLRDDITGPAVTMGNLISAFPFPNTIVLVEMKGKDIKDLFEHAAGLTNGILQVSEGVEMHYSVSAAAGNRVVLYKLNGKTFKDDKTYKVVTSNFLADGGDGFLAFRRALSKKDTRVEILQTMIQYLKSFDVYKPQLFGRVVKVKP
ncbi:bifunctional metallophosphatase/5'-nucleotidase [bacterium]|nr:bifunctional metallophosphatase/5'-nucleotidase [bacterium]